MIIRKNLSTMDELRYATLLETWRRAFLTSSRARMLRCRVVPRGRARTSGADTPMFVWLSSSPEEAAEYAKRTLLDVRCDDALSPEWVLCAQPDRCAVRGHVVLVCDHRPPVSPMAPAHAQKREARTTSLRKRPRVRARMVWNPDTPCSRTRRASFAPRPRAS